MAERVRPDFSEYVAHFTKDPAKDHSQLSEPDIASLTARQRLAAVLEERRIRRTRMPWFGAHCASFTECTWTSLLDHAEHYSAYGVGFTKTLLWQQGGGPAIYLRVPDLYDAQSDYVEGLVGWVEGGSREGRPLPFAEHVKDFLTPFAKERFTLRRVPGVSVDTGIDYSHEREWRVPNGLSFEYADVQFVIVRDFADVGALPAQAVDAIGKDRFLSMSNYQQVEDLWPMLHIRR
jgi:hypothetical protein